MKTTTSDTSASAPMLRSQKQKPSPKPSPSTHQHPLALPHAKNTVLASKHHSSTPATTVPTLPLPHSNISSHSSFVWNWNVSTAGRRDFWMKTMAVALGVVVLCSLALCCLVCRNKKKHKPLGSLNAGDRGHRQKHYPPRQHHQARQRQQQEHQTLADFDKLNNNWLSTDMEDIASVPTFH